MQETNVDLNSVQKALVSFLKIANSLIHSYFNTFYHFRFALVCSRRSIQATHFALKCVG